ncbi:zona pellucida sperm-binding protein 3-like [Hoplias malabaricus]|uniref:zona pellucida sperm-binding protein 3-like n=1 Tax=Hoplias malabaricus TaxID=27720 RepID=UPI0034627C79
MGLKPVGLVLLFAVVNFSEAQRKTWNLGGTPAGQTGSRKHPQRQSEELVPFLTALQSQNFGQMNPEVVLPNQQVVQEAMYLQSQQLIQGPVKTVTWRFPVVPEQPKQPPVPFQLRDPIPPSSVAAKCEENVVHVEVKQDFFGTGQLLIPSAFTLGSCSPSGQDVTANVLIFESELQACGSTLRMTEDELVYTFMLIYTPEVFQSAPIVRVGSAAVSIECHYSRKNNVSSSSLLPAWIPYSATAAAEEQLVFSLKPMTDDWQYERPSYQFYLGEFINIEASVMQFNHAPLRIFVDSCVATPVPDVGADPKYSIIENHGCLVDAKITASRSHFLPQDQSNKLQFQLEAFRFLQDNSGEVYVTCLLKVMAASSFIDAENKACSFSANRWTAACGDDQVCSCCETTCSSRNGRDVSAEELQKIEKVILGPLLVDDAVDAEVDGSLGAADSLNKFTLK